MKELQEELYRTGNISLLAGKVQERLEVLQDVVRDGRGDLYRALELHARRYVDMTLRLRELTAELESPHNSPTSEDMVVDEN